jgi:hypothetical protein
MLYHTKLRFSQTSMTDFLSNVRLGQKCEIIKTAFKVRQKGRLWVVRIAFEGVIISAANEQRVRGESFKKTSERTNEGAATFRRMTLHSIQ